jgi:hypothetical protein
MAAEATGRRAIALVLAVCMVAAGACAQQPNPVSLKRGVVLTDAKGNDKSTRLEFEVVTADVVDHATLSYRLRRGDRYRNVRLSTNRALLYEATLPYSGRIEYFLTVVSERGRVLGLGSASDPEALDTEDLPRIRAAGHSRLKKALILGTIGIVIVLAAVFGFGRGRVHQPSGTSGGQP